MLAALPGSPSSVASPRGKTSTALNQLWSQDTVAAARLSDTDTGLPGWAHRQVATLMTQCWTARSHTGRRERRLLHNSFSPAPSSFAITLSHPGGAWLTAVLLCWGAPRVGPLLLLAYSCLPVALPPGTLPGLSCWSRDGGTELLAWLHQHLLPLAVPVAPGRSLAHKKRLGRAKLEGDRATSIVVSPSPALGDPTAMVHRETTGMRLVCVSLGFGVDYWLGIGWEGDVATGLFPCILLSWHFASENAMPAVRYRNHKYYCPTRSQFVLSKRYPGEQNPVMGSSAFSSSLA